jgi:hypothetical protein
MVIEWCKYVNGTTIFPKLPVYLQMYYKRWERNHRVKDVVKSSKTGIQLLQQLNNKHMLLPSDTPNQPSSPDEDTDDAYEFGTSGPMDDGDGAYATQEIEVPRFADWATVAAATPMPQPQY